MADEPCLNIIRTVGQEPTTSKLLGFFDPESIAAAFEENQWDTSEMIRQLTSIALNAQENTARERMAAMKMLQDQGKEALQLHGHIRRIEMTAEREQDGVKETLTAEGMQLLKEGTQRTLSTIDMLEAAEHVTELIDLEPKDDNGHTTDAAVPTRKPDDQLRLPDSTGGSSSDGGSTGRDGDGCASEHVSDVTQLHGSEWTSTSDTESADEGNDTRPIGGTDYERESRTTEQPGGGLPSGSIGEPSGGHSVDVEAVDPGSTRRTTPYTPGESRRRATARARAPVATDATGPPTLGDTRQPDGGSDAPFSRTPATPDPNPGDWKSALESRANGVP